MSNRPEIKIALRLTFGYGGWSLERAADTTHSGTRWTTIEKDITPKRARKIAGLLGQSIAADVEQVVAANAEWTRQQADTAREHAADAAAREARAVFDSEAAARQAEADAEALGLRR